MDTGGLDGICCHTFLLLIHLTRTTIPIPKVNPTASNIGNYLVIQKLFRETLLDRMVGNLYDDPRGSGLFLDLAAYYIITQCNAGQYYPDYAYNHPLSTPEFKIYSDSTVCSNENTANNPECIRHQHQ